MRTLITIPLLFIFSFSFGQKDTLTHFNKGKISFDASFSTHWNSYHIITLYSTTDHYVTNAYIYHFQNVVTGKIGFDLGGQAIYHKSERLQFRAGLTISDKGLKEKGLVMWANNNYADSLVPDPKSNIFLFLEAPAALQFSFPFIGASASAYFGPVISGNVCKDVFNTLVPPATNINHPASKLHNAPRFSLLYCGMTAGFNFALPFADHSLSVGVEGKYYYSYFVPRLSYNAFRKDIYSGTMFNGSQLALLPYSFGIQFIYHFNHT